MADWIAFDGTDVSELSRRTSQEARLGVGDVAEAILAVEGPTLAILPAGQGITQVLTVRRTRQTSPLPAPTVATGFLGLTDVPISQDLPQVKLSWWEKLLPRR